MGYVARVPSSVGQLEENLVKIFQNKGHVKGVRVNETTSHIEVDLDWSAHNFGGDGGKDFYIPIKRGKTREAKDLVDRMLGSGHAPTHSEAQELYDLIDPQNR
jgi:pentatricopeptide repeat protein